MELIEQTFTRVPPDLTGPVRLQAEGFGELEELLFESAVHPYGDFDRQRVAWVAEVAAQHIEHCTEYARLARHAGFRPDDLLVSGDLARVPLLSSSIFKKRRVSSLISEPIVWCSSSGTSGTKSVVARDRASLERFVGSMLYGLRTLYEARENRRAFVLSPDVDDAADLWFAYVLGLIGLVHDTDFYVSRGVFDPARLFEDLSALDSEVQPFLVGPPALIADFVAWLDRSGRKLDLARFEGAVVTAGGWKARQTEAISREELARRVEVSLGITGSNIRDCFNMVELNTVIFECSHHAKHVPPWLTVIPRRVSDLAPEKPSCSGVLSYLDPTATSFPCLVLSDDWGRVEHRECGCGRHSPVVEIERRISTIEERGCALKMERYRNGEGA